MCGGAALARTTSRYIGDELGKTNRRARLSDKLISMSLHKFLFTIEANSIIYRRER